MENMFTVNKEEYLLMIRKKKSILSIMLAVLLCVTSFAGCGSKDNTNDGATEPSSSVDSTGSDSQDNSAVYQQEPVKEFSADELLSGKHHVEMDMGDLGVIKLELDADQAPISVTNFIDLAKQGFYDGLTFHRIFPGSFMQGGDPNGNGTGGPGYRIKGEFTANGVENNISHVRGAISMARTQDYDGGGCQFFIMDSDYTDFDGQYAAFGNVTDGMDIVDKICTETQIEDSNGSVAADNQPVIKEIRVID